MTVTCTGQRSKCSTTLRKGIFVSSKGDEPLKAAKSRTRAPAPAPDLRQGMQETYAVNDRMNQLVLEHLDPRAWRAQLPGSKGRTIAAIFAHVHNIRCKWLRLSAPHLKLPPRLDRSRCTQAQVQAAFAASGELCVRMLADALADGR